MSEPTTKELPECVYRVARRGSVLRPSRITPEDAPLRSGGNRFDVAGGGVLYVGTTAEACFAETLARFRPSLTVQTAVGEDPPFMPPGSVPRDWRTRRVKAEILADNPLPFLDVESPETHAHLSQVLTTELVALGYSQPLDLSDILNRDRLLSRAVSLYAYAATTPDGQLIYSGVRYISRISADWECWAIFDGTDVRSRVEQTIEWNDPDFQKVCKLWNLKPH